MFKSIRALYLLPIGIYLIAACILYMLIANKGHYDVDSYGYTSIADYFLKTGVLTDPHQIESPPVQPVGYPFFLALVLWLFGCMLPHVIIVQSLCACLVIASTVYTARTLYGDTVAWYTALLCTGNVGYLIYAQLLLAEIVLMSLLSLFMLRYLYFLKTSSSQALVQAGLLLGLSMLIKPVALLFVMPLICITAVSSSHGMRLKAVLCITIAFSLPILCYMGRNYFMYGRLFFAPMAHLNMYQCFLAKVMSEVESVPEQFIIETRLRFAGSSLADSTGWQQAQTYFYRYLLRWPHIFVRIWFVNVIKTWFGLYVTQLKKMIDVHLDSVHSFFGQQGSLLQRAWAYIRGGTDCCWVQALSCYECMYSIIRLLGALVGLCVLYTRKHYVHLALYVSMMISFSLVTGMDGCCRYRIAYENILLLLAAIGLAYIVSYYKQSIKEYAYGVT